MTCGYHYLTVIDVHGNNKPNRLPNSYATDCIMYATQYQLYFAFNRHKILIFNLKMKLFLLLKSYLMLMGLLMSQV
jgi:hypothetical protein